MHCACWYRCAHTFSFVRFERVILNVGNSTNFCGKWPTVSSMNIANILFCLAACFFYCSFAFRYDDRTILRYYCTTNFHFTPRSPFGKLPFLAGAKRSDFSLAYQSSFPDLSPNGENYLQFAKTPEALFFRYDIDHNFTQAESPTDGLIYPIMALHPNGTCQFYIYWFRRLCFPTWTPFTAINGEELVPQAYGIESGW